jgi:hypothetical protein
VPPDTFSGYGAEAGGRSQHRRLAPAEDGAAAPPALSFSGYASD